MVWVDKAASMKPSYITAKADYEREVKNKFEEIINKNRKKLLKGKIEYKIRKGKVYKEIVNQATYSDAFLIVAGTHGASGFEEFWIGSNAYRIVAAASCPVITIRNGFCLLESTSKILLPIDSTLETRQKVPFTTELAKAFGAEIILLSLYTSSVKEVKEIVDSYAQQAKNYIVKHTVRYSSDKSQVEGNLADNVIEYAVKNNVDLISIMTEQEISATNLILGTYAQQIVNHSPIPVLSQHAADIFEIATR
jgi:nucleotide-binding universal stress UspA family protein